MQGAYLRKKFSILDFLCLIAGMASIGFYVYLKIKVPDEAKDLLFFLILGIILCVFFVLSQLLTSRGYLSVDKDGIKARYGFFWKIDCKLSDVSFVNAQGYFLTIHLKNNTTHTIPNLTNARLLASFIRKNMSYQEAEQPKVLMEKCNMLKKGRKKSLVAVVIGLGLMFLNIFITVFLTDGKNLNEFGKSDWIIFSIMGAIEIITFIALFWIAQKAGKVIVPIQKTEYLIRKRMIETTPVLPGNAIRVFADEEYSGRVTIFGYPNDDNVYFTVEGLESDYSLVTKYESGIYENMDQLMGELDLQMDILHTMVDITKTMSVPPQ